ncbi:13910_t:CDS:2 [Entrophospora sp. SA101]|nr:10011_t:CDS:2 [Entrophospora sp. SA101]CAJ0825092.1 16430_t:CDS:2 [Entrophospora sp. SA101]CAJ0835537.1 13910_t:CDS:2 [Entrophospora sp. SA101]CAJ0908961.1 6216_t:CDS:2 [Entrophospora sp. SA101]
MDIDPKPLKKTKRTTKMEYRYLGNSGLKVSVISLGGWVTFGGQVAPETTRECMQIAFENGVNYFDTAEVYAGGKSELDMGNAIKILDWKRSDFVISTKIFWGGKGPNDRGLSRKHIVEGLNASLKRLGLDYVDLVYAHRPDPDTPMEEIVRAFNFVIDQGKAYYWGTSEWPADQIVEAHGIANRLGLISPLVEQVQYNMFHRERVENEYLHLFKEYKMGAATWSPLASGILTGKHNRQIAEGSRLTLRENAVMQRLKEELLSNQGKTKLEKVENLKNINAVGLVSKLTPEILEEIESILDNKPPMPFNFRDS